MSRRDVTAKRLDDLLDAQGDLAPPWARLPQCERDSLGWRMGMGESWLMMWAEFLRRMPADAQTRAAYLRRHWPAPHPWAGAVARVLGWPPIEEQDEDRQQALERERLEALVSMGLVASDCAFEAWCALDEWADWSPWDSSPQEAARDQTRELWFWGRRQRLLAPERRQPPPPSREPESWAQCVATPVSEASARHGGLWALAGMLARGEVCPPWALGLSVSQARDSFELDMGYVDAFGLSSPKRLIQQM